MSRWPLALVVIALALPGCAEQPRHDEMTITCPPPAREPAGGQSAGDSAIVTVHDAPSLKAALATAAAGQTIVLAPGRYEGKFAATARGTVAAPVTLCGTREAVLAGGTDGYVLHLDGASHWRVGGFRVSGGQKGIVLDATTDSLLDNLEVADSTMEAVHLRRASSNNVVHGLHISRTGRGQADRGEGIYVGSAVSNWCTYSECQPDRSDRNSLLENTFGPDVSAENIDVKEGTTAGLIRGNVFDGTGTTGADSWLDVKGNGWEITDNRGTKAPRDGMQVHVVAPGWGSGQRFAGNAVEASADGVGIRVPAKDTDTRVECSNVITGSGPLSNVACVTDQPKG